MNETPFVVELRKLNLTIGEVTPVKHEHATHLIKGYHLNGENFLFEKPVDNSVSENNIVENEVARFGVHQLGTKEISLIRALLNANVEFVVDNSLEWVGVCATTERIDLEYRVHPNSVCDYENIDFMLMACKHLESSIPLEKATSLNEFKVKTIELYSKVFETKSLGVITSRTTAEVAIIFKGENNEVLMIACPQQQYVEFGYIDVCEVSSEIVDYVGKNKLMKMRTL